jgi:hypothetical protein
MDEVQDSYADQLFWNDFFKGVQDGRHRHYRVMLFCSYGSPSARPVPQKIGTPLVLTNAAHVSLWPTETCPGLLLNRAEFDEVLERYDKNMKLEPKLQNQFFHWTGGHVGAVVKLLSIVSHQVILLLKTQV